MGSIVAQLALVEIKFGIEFYKVSAEKKLFLTIN